MLNLAIPQRYRHFTSVSTQYPSQSQVDEPQCRPECMKKRPVSVTVRHRTPDLPVIQPLVLSLYWYIPDHHHHHLYHYHYIIATSIDVIATVMMIIFIVIIASNLRSFFLVVTSLNQRYAPLLQCCVQRSCCVRSVSSAGLVVLPDTVLPFTVNSCSPQWVLVW